MHFKVLTSQAPERRALTAFHEHADTAQPAANGMGSPDNPIAAVLVFKDPTDWCALRSCVFT